jgi:hypothetical protein
MSADPIPQCWLCDRTATEANPVVWEPHVKEYECAECTIEISQVDRTRPPAPVKSLSERMQPRSKEKP